MSSRTTAAPPPPPRRAGARPRGAAKDAAKGAGGVDEAMEARVVRHGLPRWLIAVGVLAAAGLVAYGASLSPFLDVDHVVVRGAQHTPATQLERAAGVAKGDALFWFSTGDAVHGLEALPFVKTAKVTKEWPDTVRIVVTERAPAGWAEGPVGKVLVDRTGRVLAVVDAPPPGLPKLLGLTGVPGTGGTVAPLGPARAAGVLPVFAAGGTTSVTAVDGGNLTMQLVNGTELRLGDDTQLGAKVTAALAVLNAMAGQPVQYVDVSVPTNPVAG